MSGGLAVPSPAPKSTAYTPGVAYTPPATVTGDPPAVRLVGLGKRYPARRPWREAIRRPFAVESQVALADVTLDVASGTLLGVLGPNGAGKSTLFRLLTTLLLPDEGHAELFGVDVALDPADARQLLAGAGSDERSLYWRLDAVENLRLFASLHGFRGADAARRIDEALGVVGLSDTRTRMVGQFSSGMRQRLLVARALLARPRILLLDEPTRSLDPLTARDLRTFLRDELVGRLGTTVLLATHTAEEAFALCDRVAILHRGRLLAHGAPSTLAAEFTGSRRRLVCRDVDARHAAALLTAAGGTVDGAWSAEEIGWVGLEIGLPFVSSDGDAAILAALTGADIRVARFEPVAVPLAELLERAIARDDGSGRGGSCAR